MPTYSYRAYNDQQKVYHSSLESSSLSEAKAKLIEQNVSFFSIKEMAVKKKKTISRKQLLLFTEELYRLLNANLPLYDALCLIKEQFHQDRISSIIDQILKRLKSGSSFSEALKEYPEHFDLLYCTLVEMGESSGQLSIGLEHLSHEISKSYETSKKIKAALLYPMILSIFCLIVLAVLMGYVVPSIENLFEFSNLGTFTRVVIGSCHHLKQWGIIYLLGLGSILLLLKGAMKAHRYQRSMSLIILSLPKLGTFFKDFQLYRWSSTLVMLLKGGVPLVDSLALGEKTQSNLILKESLAHCRQKVSMGSALSSELKAQPYFSSLLVQLITIGENSGDLVSSFDRISSLLEESVQKRLHQFMTLLTPLSLLLMAALIGIVMLAILIPLTDINSLLS